jgi:hypothetical protein
MQTQEQLNSRMSLGGNCSIQPPQGWAQEAMVNDNPLWLLPKNRAKWQPPDAPDVTLHWTLSATPLPQPEMEFLTQLLDGLPGSVSKVYLEELYPALIRIPLTAITEARIVEYENSGTFLCVEYNFEEYGEKGIVHYAPTDKGNFGEFQILAYEGKGEKYDRFLDVAKASMESFNNQESG